jgi:hypothetical protein
MKENPMFKALVLALSLVGFQAFAETKFNISGDAYVRGYFLNGTGPSQTQAFAQFLRVNADAKADEHLTLKTGLVLAAENWEGDAHKPIYSSNINNGGTGVGGKNEDGTGNGNATHLDHAVIEYNSNGWITSVGRQAVSSPGNFLTSDDRRDRIQVLKVFPTFDVLAFIYDKRAEGSLANGNDDLDMYSINYYGTYGQFKYALQTGYFTSKKYDITTSGYNLPINLDGVKQFTPQLSTSFAGLDINLYYTVLWGGSAFYKDTHHSAALKLSREFEFAKVEYESVVVKDGGLVANGFDTLSSIINNNPDHNQSHINLRSIGLDLGTKGADEYTHMVKVSKKFFNDLAVSVGAGCAKFYVSQVKPSELDTVLDATAKYTVSANLNLAAAYGTFLGDNEDHAGSLTLNANF